MGILLLPTIDCHGEKINSSIQTNIVLIMIINYSMSFLFYYSPLILKIMTHNTVTMVAVLVVVRSTIHWLMSHGDDPGVFGSLFRTGGFVQILFQPLVVFRD